MIQRPVAIGLALCEQAIVEETTRNVTLVNCFTRLNLREFPTVAQRLTVYAALTDGLGEARISLIVTRLDTLEEVYVYHDRLSFPDPLQEVRLLFRLQDCSFPAPGRYQVTLLADGELVAQHAFPVSAVEE